MKKIFLLFVSIAMLTACSNDDDGNTDDGSKIIGKWFLVDARAGEVSGNLSECKKQSYLIFNADNSAESEYYDASGGTCEVSDSSEGTWEYKGNSVYKVDVAGYGNMEGTVNFQSNSGFTFTSPNIAPIVLVFEK